MSGPGERPASGPGERPASGSGERPVRGSRGRSAAQLGGWVAARFGARFGALRRQARARRRVEGLGLPRRLTLDDLVARAETALGKPIAVRTAELPGDLSARFIQHRDRAVLETRPDLSERSRLASVLHELAHVFLDDPGCDHEAYTGLLSGRTAFTRSLDTPHEQTVELVADQLALRIGLLDPGEQERGIFR